MLIVDILDKACQLLRAAAPADRRIESTNLAPAGGVVTQQPGMLRLQRLKQADILLVSLAVAGSVLKA